MKPKDYMFNAFLNYYTVSSRPFWLPLNGLTSNYFKSLGAQVNGKVLTGICKSLELNSAPPN